MTEFLEQISLRSEEVNQDLYDILMSFTDFDEFKSLMIHAKNEKTNASNFDTELLSSSLRAVTSQGAGSDIHSKSSRGIAP